MALKVNKKKYINQGAFIILFLALQSCFLIYSFSKSSLPSEIETFSIQDFYTKTSAVGSDALAEKITRALRDNILKETSLVEVEKDGDIQFKGMVTHYEDGKGEGRKMHMKVFVEYINPYQKSFQFKKEFEKFDNEQESFQSEDFINKKNNSRIKKRGSDQEETQNILIKDIINQIMEQSIYQW